LDIIILVMLYIHKFHMVSYQKTRYQPTTDLNRISQEFSKRISTVLLVSKVQKTVLFCRI